MNKPRLLPDMISSAVAFVVSLCFAFYLHGEWYYGGWMALFGDPPAGNLAYSRFLPFFEAAPYVAAGISGGLLAGFGRPQVARVAVRGTALAVLFLLFALRNSHLAFIAFVPVAFSFFALSFFLSATYFWLLGSAPHPVPNL